MVPLPAGTSVSMLHSPDLVGEVEIPMSSVLWGNPAGQAWGQHLGLGCAPGKDNPPQLGIGDGASFDRGGWCDRPNSSSSPSTPPCIFLPFPTRNFHH